MTILGLFPQPASAATTLTPVVSGITYEPFGPITAMTYGNGIKESRAFDPDYRLATLTDTGNTPLQSLFYSYDQADNVLGIRDGVKAGNSQTFGYDALNRLTLAAGSYGNLAYDYDALGNRLTDTATPPAASPDGLGSISAVTYNQAGRVSTVTAGTQQIAAYGYDAFGQRLSRTGPTSALYKYDQTGHLIEETDGQGNLQANYVYLGDQPIASVAPNAAGSGIGTVYFLHDDRLGTPQAATDAKQTLMWQSSYQPFGATSTGIGLITQDLRLPGQEFDNVTGWNHNWFREYVPGLGRYSQSDPIGLAADLNGYLYARASPSTTVDIHGLSGNRISIQPNFGCTPFGFCATPIPTTHIGVNLQYPSGAALDYWGTNIYVGKDGTYAVEGDEINFAGPNAISAMQLARDIWNDPSYWPGDPVTLFICHAGSGTNNSLAQQVANELGVLTLASGRALGQSSPVSGPNGFLWPYFGTITQNNMMNPFGAAPPGGGQFVTKTAQ